MAYSNPEVSEILRRARHLQTFGQPISRYALRGAVRGALEASQTRLRNAEEMGLRRRASESEISAREAGIAIQREGLGIQRTQAETQKQEQEAQSTAGYITGGALLYPAVKDAASYIPDIVGYMGGIGGAGAGTATFGPLAGTGSAGTAVEGVAGSFSLGGGTGVTTTTTGAGTAGMGTLGTAGAAAGGAAAIYAHTQAATGPTAYGKAVRAITPWNDKTTEGQILNAAAVPFVAPIALGVAAIDQAIDFLGGDSFLGGGGK